MLRRNWLRPVCFLFAAFTAVLTAIADEPARLQSPVPPRDSLALFQLDEGLQIELVAAEPHIVDPVDARFDEQNRLWVIEMRDYPNGPAPGSAPRSRISVLADDDGDGYYETSCVFADGLLFATGLQPWKGGVIVTSSGQIAYLKDTDTDGRADVHEIWYTGFSEGNPQLRANHPKLGPDGWVYVACGLQGGQIVDRRHPERTPVNVSGMDFRFHPATGDCQAITGNGQFGLTFDDLGRRFVCENRHPVRHVVLEAEYLKRNPYFAAPTVVHNVAKAGDQSRVFPLTKAWTTSNLHAGQFTAACAVELYRGGSLGSTYANTAFVCEPTGNLVRGERLTAVGPTFTSKALHENREFLASRDPWFRPVNLTFGPDGALYVVDMYRAVIEHPQFMPTELQSRTDLRFGDDRGRIYRIRSKSEVRKLSPPLDGVNAIGAALASQSAWKRDTAFRLLAERDFPTIDDLGPLAGHYEALWLRTLGSSVPKERLLRLLRGKGTAANATIVAMQLAEPQLAANAELREAVVALLDSDDVACSFQAILSLGSLDDASVGASIGRTVARHHKNSWMTRAALTARPELHPFILRASFNKLKDQSVEDDSAAGELLRSLAEMMAAGVSDAAIRECLSLHNDAWREPPKLSAKDMVLVGLDDGLRRRRETLGRYVRARFDQLQPVLGNYDASMEFVGSLVRQSPSTAPSIAIDLLRVADTPLACHVLLDAIAKELLPTTKQAMIQALSQSNDSRVGPVLVEHFQKETPAVRRTILDTLLGNTQRSLVLLDVLEDRRIVRADLDQARSNRLLQHSDEVVRNRAKELLSSGNVHRAAAIADYQESLVLNGSVEAGREVFRNRCSTCHRIGDIGVNVAPDISDSREKTPQQILTDILDPNRAIDNNYVAYSVLLVDGRVLSGIISAETPTSITIKEPEGKTTSVLRSEIEQLKSTSKSLMPEGLEREINKQQMADVIQFIKHWRYVDGQAPVN